RQEAAPERIDDLRGAKHQLAQGTRDERTAEEAPERLGAFTPGAGERVVIVALGICGVLHRRLELAVVDEQLARALHRDRLAGLKRAFELGEPRAWIDRARLGEIDQHRRASQRWACPRQS